MVFVHHLVDDVVVLERAGQNQAAAGAVLTGVVTDDTGLGVDLADWDLASIKISRHRTWDPVIAQPIASVTVGFVTSSDAIPLELGLAEQCSGSAEKSTIAIGNDTALETVAVEIDAVGG